MDDHTIHQFKQPHHTVDPSLLTDLQLKTALNGREIESIKQEMAPLRASLEKLTSEVHSVNNKFSAIRNIGYGMLILYTAQTLGLDKVMTLILGIPT